MTLLAHMYQYTNSLAGCEITLTREENHVGVRIIEGHKDPRGDIQAERVLWLGQLAGITQGQLPAPVRAEPGGEEPLLAHPHNLAVLHTEYIFS
jgi:hypothetical protein